MHHFYISIAGCVWITFFYKEIFLYLPPDSHNPKLIFTAVYFRTGLLNALSRSRQINYCAHQTEIKKALLESKAA